MLEPTATGGEYEGAFIIRPRI
jgi:hypothetical protein